MKKRICGQFPEFCYKGFTCEEHAKQFIDSGTFRLNCLGYCGNMEDESRRDLTEGSGHTEEPGIVTYYGYTQNLKEKPAIVQKPGYQDELIEQGNPVYCFCTCPPEVNLDYMKDRFGRYIVKLNNPRKLAEDINDYFISKGQKFLIEGCKVVYNKGQKLVRELTDEERQELSYKQKPERFSPDCEFRIVAIKLGKVCKDECKFISGQEQFERDCKFIEVNLNKPLNYLSPVWIRASLGEGRRFKSCLPDCFLQC